MEMIKRIRAISPHGFWRCGIQFSATGKDYTEDEFTIKEWERLMAEPNLKVSEASGQKTDDELQAELAEVVTAVIKDNLGEDDFQKDGKPKVKAIEAHLNANQAALLNAKTRDAIWATLLPAEPEPGAPAS